MSTEGDNWRDDAADIEDTDHVEVTWRVWSQTGQMMINTDFVLTAEQARGALNLLADLADSVSVEPVAFHDYESDNLVVMSDGSLRDYFTLEGNE